MKKLSNSIIQKPSFINLIIGSFIHALGLNRDKEKIRQFKRIGKYKLLKAIKKENNYVDSMMGCYIKNQRSYFIKTFEAGIKDYKSYFILNEWFISNLLYKTLNIAKNKITTPKPIEIITSTKSISIVYEFIEGKTLSKFSLNYQTKTFVHIINELNQTSSLLTKDEVKLFPKRNIVFYLVSLPYLSFLTILRSNRNYGIVIKAFLATLRMLLSQNINDGLCLAHRDLKPHNVIIKDSKIYLVDIGRMVLTLPGYDLALLSLDPAYLNLSRNIEKKLKTSVNSFLKSYIAIQFADPNFNVWKKYWVFLESEYTKTYLNKGLRYDI